MSTEEDITISDKAFRKISQLIAEDGDSNLKLRVYIVGGGCSGFQYGFSFETEAEDGYLEFTREQAGKAVTVIVDPLSYNYLMGATIDYREELQGAHFVVDNPNAKTTCGCGASFSID